MILFKTIIIMITNYQALFIFGLCTSTLFFLHQEDLRNIDIQSIHYANFGVTNLLLLWFFVLFIGWVVILREFKIEAAKTSTRGKFS